MSEFVAEHDIVFGGVDIGRCSSSHLYSSTCVSGHYL